MLDDFTEKQRQSLLKLFPLPDVKNLKQRVFSFDGGGRELVEDLIDEVKPRAMLEIGCYLGGSAIRWLNYAPNMMLVGIDPWEDIAAEAMVRYLDENFFIQQVPNREERIRFVEDVKSQSMFLTSVANMSQYFERFVPVRDYSPAILPSLKHCGFKPDIIYIDSMKHGEDLEMCIKLWPNARFCGDDWTWGVNKGYPMRTAVLKFAKARNLEVLSHRATWVIKNEK